MKKPARRPSDSQPPRASRPTPRPPHQKRPPVGGNARTAGGGPRPVSAAPAKRRDGAGGAPEARDAGGDEAGAASARRHEKKTEQKVHGLRACAALFAHRPGDIIRVYLSVNRRPTFKALLEYCVAQRLGFQFVDDENLQKLSGGIHHEGIVILAREPARLGGDELLAGISTKTIHGPLLLLDGVQNPHNLGSILRSAAHFGCGAVVGEAENLPPLSAAAPISRCGSRDRAPFRASTSRWRAGSCSRRPAGGTEEQRRCRWGPRPTDRLATRDGLEKRRKQTWRRQRGRGRIPRSEVAKVRFGHRATDR